MTEIEVLRSLIGTGADAAMVAIAYVLVRIERRVYRLELQSDKKGA